MKRLLTSHSFIFILVILAFIPTAAAQERTAYDAEEITYLDERLHARRHVATAPPCAAAPASRPACQPYEEDTSS